MFDENDRNLSSGIIYGEESYISHSGTTINFPSSALLDYRVQWLREKVLIFLDLEGQDQVFNDLINSNNRENEDPLLNFLNNDNFEDDRLEARQVFFYKTYRDEIVQREVSVWVDRAKIAAMESQMQRLKSAERPKTKGGKSGSSKKPGKKSAKKAKTERRPSQPEEEEELEPVSATGVVSLHPEDLPPPFVDDFTGYSGEFEGGLDEDADDASDDMYRFLIKKNQASNLQIPSLVLDESINFVPPLGEEDNYMQTKKVVDQQVQVPVLHCFFGELDSSRSHLEQQRLIYFLRANDAPIPTFDCRETCWDEMPVHLISGSIQGDFLEYFNRMLRDVFLPMLEKQSKASDAPQGSDVSAAMDKAKTAIYELARNQGARVPSNLSLFADDDDDDQTEVLSDDDADKIEVTKLELVEHLKKLVESVNWDVDNTEGATLLTIPTVLDEIDPSVTDEELSRNKKFIELLEEIVLSWEKDIKKVLDSYRWKTYQGKGPIAEYHYWLDRESGLAANVEQLNHPSIIHVRTILDLAKSAIGHGFNYFADDIRDVYLEAKENVKFISTILRYFHIIEDVDQFTKISSIIPSLLQQLRMIWILSRYYSVEEHMVGLMEKIGWQLRQTVMKKMSLKHLFDEPLEVVMEKTEAAHKMLTQWKKSYHDTRKDIELSGKGTRWEFDKKRLFKDTDYLAASSADLNEIAGVLRDFYNIFGEDLKSIVDDPARIDSIVERVSQMIVPIRSSENDAFYEYNYESWDAIMGWFRGEVEKLEEEAKVFMDESFSSLINAEDALEMLLKFRNMKTRESVRQGLNLKFDLIIQQFSKEVDIVETNFKRYRKNPPLLRNHQPMSGSIYWERQLFYRLKQPVLRFQEIEELNDSNVKRYAFDQYANLAKTMKGFEEDMFKEFVKRAERTFRTVMSRNVLTLQLSHDKKPMDAARKHFNKAIRLSRSQKSFSSDAPTITEHSIGRFSKGDRISFNRSKARSLSSDSLKTSTTYKSARKSNRSSLRMSKSRPSTSASGVTEKQQQQLNRHMEMMRGAILLENQIKLVVNFNKDVFNIIRESELMEHMGFTLPPSIREVATQKLRLHADYEAVDKMINQYSEIISKFEDPDVLLLRKTLENVEKNIQPGVTRINWHSLSINDYTDNCKKLLKMLSSTVTQINYERRDLDKLVDGVLGTYNLFATETDPNDLDYKLRDCITFFAEIETKRTAHVSLMLKCYQSVSPMLVKLENLVEETSTGKSQAMLLYYERYEQRIFSAFITCFIKNLEYIKKRLTSPKPIFTVNAALLGTEVILRPSASEVHSLILLSVKDLMERLKVFPRWKARSCLECQPSKDPYLGVTIFSYFEDVMNIQIINDLILSVHDSSYQLAVDCNRYLLKWKQYSNLWSLDKALIAGKFASANATLQQYDEKFCFYNSIIEELDEMTDYYDVTSIRINLRPLLDGIKEHAWEWKQVMGNFLMNSTVEGMNSLKETIDRFRTEVELVITGLDRFKGVMQAISNIKRMSIQAEVNYLQYQETFRILRAHKIKFDKEQEEIAHKLEKDWKSLHLGALYRFTTLQSTKDQFADMTSREISDFCSDMDAFVIKFKTEGPGSCGDDLEAAVKKMIEFEKLIDYMEVKLIDLKNAEVLFDLPPTDYVEFYAIQKEFQAMKEVFKLYELQKSARDNWAKTLWVNLNPQELLNGMENFLREFRKLPRATRNLGVAKTLEENMKNFNNSVPLFVELKNEAMRKRHWKELMDRTGKYFDMSPKRFTLGKMFQMDLGRYQEIAETIVNNARSELAIERGVQEVARIWTEMEFKLVPHFKGGEDRGYVLGPVDELNQILEDNTLNLQSMSASQFIGPFLQEVQKWEKSMRLISDVVEAWLELQRRWMYLEGIFIGGDIRSQLPQEAQRFDDVDETFRNVMLETVKNPNVLMSCSVPNRLEEFESLTSELEQCQKSLSEYLKSKRGIFPRFSFISDDELLSILGSSEAECIQEHVGKMFDNLAKFRLGPDNQDRMVASALISAEGEVMDFTNNVIAEGPIEYWMVEALDEMRRSNRYLTKKAVFEYGKMLKSRNDWMIEFQGMMVLASNQIWWTAEVENVFRKIEKGDKRAMKDYLQQLNNQIDDMVVLMGGESLSNNDRTKLDTVLTIDVHTRDIIEDFVRDSIMDALEFEWESQLRFYWVHDVDNVWINQCSGTFEYGYEYMGLNGRLVVTPLTDRIYLTITQALSMQLGGAPAGPAGTGKTETTKDLAKALGLLCVVTNCGEGMDFVAIGKILSGLVSCGAWGCFDEFNRIDVSVLSVISTQLQTIRSALQSGVKRFMFEDQEIAMDSKVGIFITMNPGYAGRTELPESVKALFRPVVCIVPNLMLICQIKLFSAGFLTAKVLAKKMTVLYALAREQLSKQTHYDFGLRALKSVLNMAGNLKRTSGDLPENVVLMRALRDMNLPKFVFEDVPLFLGLISDLFPGLECPRVRYPDFNDAVEEALRRKNYILIPDQIDKIVQLYEIMMTRHSTMIVGPTGGGKTVVIETLCDAQTLLGNPTNLYILNPKACTVIELYGELDPATRDWTDGLLSNIFREVNKPLSDDRANEKKYILFDGDVDALWIENMNSVMDDNKILTLANQERIKLQDHCKLLFEVGDLQYASPATVSRAGMVYVDPKNLQYQPFMDKWIRSRNKSEQSFLTSMYEKYVNPAIKFILEGILGLQTVTPLKLIIPQTGLNLVTQLSVTFDALYPPPAVDKWLKDPDKEYTDSEESDFNAMVQDRNDLMEAIYIQACYCSLGAAIITEFRKDFDDFMKKTSGLMHLEDTLEKPAGPRHAPVAYPQLYDYLFDVKKHHWVPWKELVVKYVHDRKMSFSEILVPTVDTIRASWYINLMNEVDKPLLLVGDTGTSKSACINEFLRKVNQEKFSSLPINFSSRTTSLDVQRNIESIVEKRTKDTFGPPPGKRLIIFIDDMNMPMVDTYGTQQPIALLKLLLERGGFYDREKDLSWKKMKDISYIAAMGKSGGGRHDVDPRFVSMFAIYNIPFPSDQTLQYIYQSILEGHLEIFPKEIQELAEVVIKITMELYKHIIIELPPTPSKFHYIFNMRDLSRVTAGFLQSTPDFFKVPRQFIRLWRNEFSRVFGDRLISTHDQDVVNGHIEEFVKELWALEPESVQYVLRDPLLFGDFRNACNLEEPRFYEDLLDYEAVYTLFMEIMEEHNESNQRLTMVLFNAALEHLTRVHRTLRMPRSHALIVGVGGSGRRSTVKLAAFAAGCQLFEIAPSRGYDETAFRDDIKRLLSIAGLEKLPVVFLFTDEQVVDESFLEIINNLLTTGVVSSLFADDEKDSIVNQSRNAAKAANYGVTKESVWSYFAKTATENLRIALSMSPSGDILRERCRSYPGLVNCTTIDWIFPWPEQALYAVANVTLRDNPNIPEIHRDAIVRHAVFAHVLVTQFTADFLAKLRRPNYVTPRHYLDVLELYSKLLDERRTYIEFQCNRLAGGLTKIADAAKNLEQMNALLAGQTVKVENQTKNCEVLLKEISASTEVATAKQALSMEKSKDIEERNVYIAKESAEAKEALSEAQPALDNARAALDKLEKSDITEIRSFATPPEPVQIICECVTIIRGFKEISWKSAKGMMADPNFLRTLQEMECENITLKQQQMVKAHLKKSNKMDQMKTISKAGFGLYKFVLAVLEFCTVYREVKPKMDRVKELAAESAKATKALEKELAELDRLKKLLENLNKRYEVAMAERQRLQDETDLLERRLIAADKLINGLSSEDARWKEDLKDLKIELEKIVGNCLLSAGFLSYHGPFTFEFRVEMLYKHWQGSIIEKKIPLSQPFRIERQLSNDVEISGWNSEGLPPDELSIQNAILTVRASRFPLCIDPQQQALRWIKKREEKNSLKMLTFNDSDFIKQVEISVKYGFPVMFQDVDYVDPVLDNVIMKNIQVVGARSTVILGDKEVDYDPRFRMYLITKHSNPILNPTIYAKATVINYMVTTTGLEEQLLSVVVQTERPDIEEQREALINETSAHKALIQQLEDSLLREISTNQGNMLDNMDLIETLENTKSSAIEISTKLAEAVVTAKEIDNLRNDYRPAAKRGAILFFVLADMAIVGPMYQYSLNSYLEVFVQALKKAKADPLLMRRLKNVVFTLTRIVYDYGCTGIFERHKLLFSFQICTRIEKDKHNLSQDQLDFFIKGNVSLERSAKVNPTTWLSVASWEDILKLANDFPDKFRELPDEVENNEAEWKHWYDLDNPESVEFPCNYSGKLTSIETLMLLRCFRVDRVYRGVIIYISKTMGEDFITPPSVGLDAIFDQSTPTMPVVFVLSPGSDPTNELIKLARIVGMGGGKFRHLSLGQGQEKAAISALENATLNGCWLMLQNCHLLLRFTRELEKRLENIGKPDDNFRLWLTTDPNPDFPIGILQQSLKVVTEPPNGLKLNLKNTYLKMGKQLLDTCEHPAFKDLVYILAFYHAVVQERRKYDKIGWNINYDFNESDFNVCTMILDTYLTKNLEMKETRIPWNTLKYLIGEVMYGGRIIDDFDRRVSKVYMDEYMGDFLFDSFQPYHFYKDDNVDYYVPPKGDHESYLDFIEDLPLVNSPEVFGLHPNAEIGYFTQATKEMWTNLIQLQPQTAVAGSGVSRDEFIDNLAIEILGKIPPEYDMVKIKRNFGVSVSPTTIVLFQELERFNKLIKRMRTTLEQLRKALAGEIGMDAVLESVANSLFNGTLPQAWARLAPATKKNLSGWMEHFERRIEQYTSWSGCNEPVVMWLSGLHIPETYLAALIQMACRRNNWPLDRSVMYTAVTDYVTADLVEERPDEGCYVQGLYIEGARWDVKEGCLKRSHPKVLIEELPVLLVIPIESHRLKLLNTIKTPVYTTSDRRNAMGVGLVFEADLATAEHISHWILQGVCLILNTD